MGTTTQAGKELGDKGAVATYATLRGLRSSRFHDRTLARLSSNGDGRAIPQDGADSVIVERLMLTGLEPDERTTLVDRASVWANVVSPYLPRVVEARAAGAVLTLACHAVAGEWLDELSEAERAQHTKLLALPVELRVVLDVLSALSAMHTHQVNGVPLFHGAVAPCHVLVGVDGQARLTHAIWPPGLLPPGALAYMAPEMLLNDGSADVRADVYSGSVLLWEALSGTRLFGNEEAGGADAILARQLAGPPPRPVVREDWAQPLVDIALRGLSVNPTKRPAAVSEIAMAIRMVAQARLAAPSRVGRMVESLVEDRLRRRKADPTKPGSLAPNKPTTETTHRPATRNHASLADTARLAPVTFDKAGNPRPMVAANGGAPLRTPVPATSTAAPILTPSRIRPSPPRLGESPAMAPRPMTTTPAVFDDIEDVSEDGFETLAPPPPAAPVTPRAAHVPPALPFRTPAAGPPPLHARAVQVAVPTPIVPMVIPPVSLESDRFPAATASGHGAETATTRANEPLYGGQVPASALAMPAVPPSAPLADDGSEAEATSGIVPMQVVRQAQLGSPDVAPTAKRKRALWFAAALAGAASFWLVMWATHHPRGAAIDAPTAPVHASDSRPPVAQADEPKPANGEQPRAADTESASPATSASVIDATDTQAAAAATASSPARPTTSDSTGIGRPRKAEPKRKGRSSQYEPEGI